MFEEYFRQRTMQIEIPPTPENCISVQNKIEFVRFVYEKDKESKGCKESKERWYMDINPRKVTTQTGELGVAIYHTIHLGSIIDYNKPDGCQRKFKKIA